MPELDGVRRLLVVAGSHDIHKPLFRSLAERTDEEVVMVGEGGDDELVAELEREADGGRCIAIPGNEISLNRLVAAVGKMRKHLRQAIQVPGSAESHSGTTYGPECLSDKSVAIRLAERLPLAKVSLVSSAEIDAPADMRILEECLAKIEGPWVVKPVTKDACDSFSRRYPDKICVCTDAASIAAILNEPAFRRRRFQIQTFVAGRTISWVGSFAQGQQLCSLEIRALIKAPAGCGGTTVLAEAGPARDSLSDAAAELGSRLGLDGLFEIEFQVDQLERVWFFGELNPRPWLQIAMVLDRDPDPLLVYLKRIGCGVQTEMQGQYPVRWGSTMRYMQLNQSRLSARDILRIMVCEVRLSSFFTLREKLKFLMHELFPALFARRGDIRWI